MTRLPYEPILCFYRPDRANLLRPMSAGPTASFGFYGRFRIQVLIDVLPDHTDGKCHRQPRLRIEKWPSTVLVWATPRTYSLQPWLAMECAAIVLPGER
jgi:hypothetical protein